MRVARLSIFDLRMPLEVTGAKYPYCKAEITAVGPVD
jgi:hypothetical protein